MSDNSKLSGAEFFRKYANIVTEAEQSGEDKIAALLMQYANGQLTEDDLTEGLATKIAALAIAGAIGVSALSVGNSPSSQGAEGFNPVTVEQTAAIHKVEQKINSLKQQGKQYTLSDAKEDARYIDLAIENDANATIKQTDASFNQGRINRKDRNDYNQVTGINLHGNYDQVNKDATHNLPSSARDYMQSGNKY